ncbi:unnamed protein product, partial [Discosporangium mesarthrocarpum]
RGGPLPTGLEGLWDRPVEQSPLAPLPVVLRSGSVQEAVKGAVVNAASSRRPCEEIRRLVTSRGGKIWPLLLPGQAAPTADTRVQGQGQRREWATAAAAETAQTVGGEGVTPQGASSIAQAAGVEGAEKAGLLTGAVKGGGAG